MKAVVTGSSKGIGKAIAVSLVKEGWDVALTSRNLKELKSIADELKEIRPEAQIEIHEIDFSIPDAAREYGEAILDIWYGVDMLVNNAGLYLPGTVENEDEGVLEKLLQVNLLSPYHLSRTLLPVMRKANQGRIVNICSVASILAYPNGGAYTISKFGLYGFSKSLREELKNTNIKVTSILPGATWSDSWKGADLPFERLMPAEDIAQTVLYLTRLSDQSNPEEIIIRPQQGDL